MFQTGFFTIAHFGGAPIRVHWSTPLGPLFFGHFAFVPGFWVGFLALILIHEVGHAIVVKACRQQVVSIDILPIGGLCRWSGYVGETHRAMIAWGGVWAQMILFAVTQIALLSFTPSSRFSAELVMAFTGTNLWLMAFNLLPVRPLDGAEAWPLIGLWWRRYRMKRAIHRRVEPAPKKAPPPPDAKYSDRVKDPKTSDELFNKLMSNNPVREDHES